ncbi:MAG: hypothetical protein JWQ27_636 [Ferruginibacter sp.]|nr:hypothetical protein [Ferruginibacter sp.]
MARTVLITGANGFVGQYLSRKLVLLGFRVIATGKGKQRFNIASKRFIYEPLDFTIAEEVTILMEKYLPDVMLHSGAMSKPDECEQRQEEAFRVNVTGTKLLLDAGAKIKAHFIFLSTDFVFDGLEGPYDEAATYSPVNYYGKTKVLAESAVKNYPFTWSIVRTSSVYGDPMGTRNNLVTLVREKLLAGEMMHIFDDQVRRPTYVEDLVEGITAIIEKASCGVFHLCGKDDITIFGLAMLTAKHLGLDVKLIKAVQADNFPQPAKRPVDTRLNTGKAKKILDYSPRNLATGIALCFPN